ncbi:dermonecrotic toxin domain-containing protein [Pseudomonas sp. efr-133-TYG-103a]|uniref:dermonecrotic toxin domain-containing protein n=1 Tax=Pseudomonas sp. efr-133-TYG-103a TaxID=3040308 RepID=UPI002553876A|nr:DUF6543 domain-containing protein [Pseudomonas sp. efr-133-TYG-103a]
MSTAIADYFHTTALRKRFTDDVEAALLAGALNADERQWLLSLNHRPTPDNPDPVRVDRLLFDDGRAAPFDMSTARMLSHTTATHPRVYVHSLAAGLESFTDRRALLVALSARFAEGQANAPFEYERIETDPFQAQMFAILDAQAQTVSQLTGQLKGMPFLINATTAALERTLTKTLPLREQNPATHLLQIVQTASGDNPERVLATQSLAQCAFDDYCKNGLMEGIERRFLDVDGRVVDAEEAARLAQALSDSVGLVAAQFGELLDSFWLDTREGVQSRRDLAVANFNNSVVHALYRCQQSGQLTPEEFKALRPLLQSLVGTLPHGYGVQCQRLSIRAGSGTRHALAATFVLRLGLSGDSAVWWFTPAQSLHRFNDPVSFGAHLNSAPGREQLRGALAIEQQSLLTGSDALNVTLEDITGAVFADRVDSIIALQQANLAYAARLSNAPDAMSSMFDDALDVRALLDPRLLPFGSGRWRQAAPFDFTGIWQFDAEGQALVAVSPPDEEDGLAEQEDDISQASARAMFTPSWREQTRIADWLAGELHEQNQGLYEYAELALQRRLCVLTPLAVRAGGVSVQWREAAAGADGLEGANIATATITRTSDLLSLLLERVSGLRPTTVGLSGLTYSPAAVARALSGEGVLEHVLERAAQDFTASYLGYFRQSKTSMARTNDRHWQPVIVATNLRHDTARIDLALAERLASIAPAGVGIARQVLDRPVRAQRIDSPGPTTEVFSISLLYGSQAVAQLSDTMVVSQPAQTGAGLMLWSSLHGWRHYRSLEHLQTRLQAHFHGRYSELWLGLVGETQRAPLRVHLHKATDSSLRLRLDRVDGHAFEALQGGVLRRQELNLQALCERAVRCRFDARLFLGLASAAQVDEQLDGMLDGLSLGISRTLFEAMLPPWLTAASLDQLFVYVELWRRLYRASEGGEDFLFGIPSLFEFAHAQLVAQLKLDFIDQTLDPDLITVTARHFVAAPVLAGQTPSGIPAATIIRKESLTEYSANRFVDLQDAVLSIDSVEQAEAAKLLTPDYLRKLVRKLDVGAGFMTLLRDGLNQDGADYARRQRLFINQLPTMMQVVAYQLKLEKSLSDTAFQFIAQVGDMPDGIAREPVGDTRVIISPLQLVADAGMSPDRCLGLYLIGSADAQAGPVILYALQNSGFTFREFDSRDAVVQAIRTETELQSLLLARMDPDVRKRYDNGGFNEPHLPFYAASMGDVPLRKPGPVTLAVEEVRGNALLMLFTDTCELLLDIGMSNSVTTLEADAASRRFLMTLGMEQALSLLPGKLAALVSLWQSHSLVRASFNSASGKRWGEALSEFSAALGVMATARGQALDEQVREELASDQPHTARVTEEEKAATNLGWSGANLSGEQLRRLQALEVKNVALNDLRRDELLSLYRDPRSDATYAAVNGRIYRVSRNDREGRWMIVGSDGAAGPRLTLDDDQRWQMDLSVGLKGGGGFVSRLRERYTTVDASDVMVIEAEGMPQIRALFRDKARRIGQAHLRAKRYLETCLDNLNAHQRTEPLDPRVAAILTEFYGTRTLDRPLLERTEQAIKALFNALMDASLAPFSSSRFVVGTNRPGAQTTIGFVYKTDPQKRIFLTECFFQVPAYRLNARAAAEGFDLGPHYRAATLLHELSHLALNTHDIAYLESSAPYADLIAEDDASNVRLKADIERFQTRELSGQSDRRALFLMLDGGQWRDIGPDDNRGYDTILALTESESLDEARHVFLTDVAKRSQVMLSNADSLTLLILRLGRRNFVVPTPEASAPQPGQSA